LEQTVYLDTSIVSAYYDARNPERQKLTREFWEKLKSYQILTSALVLTEIGKLKDSTRKGKLLKLLEGAEEVPVNEECQHLADEYLKRGIIPAKYRDDAVHIAVAVVHSADYLVSWNFDHIVKVKTRRMVGRLDAEKGYKPMEIIAPPEL
jgi:predicted nucleic acid-binding protein